MLRGATDDIRLLSLSKIHLELYSDSKLLNKDISFLTLYWKGFWYPERGFIFFLGEDLYYLT